MPALSHIHTYIRSSWDKNVYQCADPFCMHYIHKRYIKGKRSICGKCHETEITLSYEHLRRAIPLCDGCSETRASKVKAATTELINEILKGDQNAA